MTRRKKVEKSDLQAAADADQHEHMQAEFPEAPAPEPPRDNDFAPERGTLPGNMPSVHADFERIVESIYTVKPVETYERLAKALRIGEKRGDYSTVNAAADDAEGNAKEAHALYLAAQLEVARWEADSAIIMAPMRSEANAELQREKHEGNRNKTITDADIDAKMCALHPEEVKWHKEKAAKLKGLVAHLLNDAEIWKGRCTRVGTMLGAIRRT